MTPNFKMKDMTLSLLSVPLSTFIERERESTVLEMGCLDWLHPRGKQIATCLSNIGLRDRSSIIFQLLDNLQANLGRLNTHSKKKQHKCIAGHNL